MTYAIRAWRDSQGAHGITIGVLTAVGYDNIVAELDLTDPEEIDRFLAGCLIARRRARDAVGPLREELPGPYEDWDGRHGG
jgi:hypothetical protein